MEFLSTKISEEYHNVEKSGNDEYYVAAAVTDTENEMFLEDCTALNARSFIVRDYRQVNLIVTVEQNEN